MFITWKLLPVTVWVLLVANMLLSLLPLPSFDTTLALKPQSTTINNSQQQSTRGGRGGAMSAWMDPWRVVGCFQMVQNGILRVSGCSTGISIGFLPVRCQRFQIFLLGRFGFLLVNLKEQINSSIHQFINSSMYDIRIKWKWTPIGRQLDAKRTSNTQKWTQEWT